MVLAGEAAPALLDTYGAERRPIGWLRHQQTFARPDYRRWAGDALAHEPLYSGEAMELGQRVASAAVIGDGGDQGTLPPAAHPDVWAGQPGTRVPHVWVDRAGRRVSTLDLFTDHLTLVSADARWIEAARRAADAAGVTVGTVHAGADVRFPADRSFEATFGVAREGACLVRPDAVVAGRARDLAADPELALHDVLAEVLGRVR